MLSRPARRPEDYGTTAAGVAAMLQVSLQLAAARTLVCSRAFCRPPATPA